MEGYLNQDLQFDDVRWKIMQQIGEDSLVSFQGAPIKTLLPAGTRLYRLLRRADGRYFNESWWMTKKVFVELYEAATRPKHGGGALLRNYIA